MALIKRAELQRKRCVEASDKLAATRQAAEAVRREAKLNDPDLSMRLEVMEGGFDLDVDGDGAFLSVAQTDKLREWLNWWAQEVNYHEE